MARGNNYSVQQVLQRLRKDQLDDSCDEEEENELQDEYFIPTYVAADELCDSDADSDEDIPASSSTATLDTASGSNNNTSATPDIPDQLIARNGTLRKNITGATAVGRACAANVFSECSGPTSHCHRYNVHGSRTVLFTCLLTNTSWSVFKSTRSTTEKLMIEISIFTWMNWRVLLVSNLLEMCWLEEILRSNSFGAKTGDNRFSEILIVVTDTRKL